MPEDRAEYGEEVTHEARCDHCQAGLYDQIIVPIKLQEGIGPSEIQINCPQCTQPMEVRKRD